MHGLKRRVDANSLSLFPQPPLAKPGIVFSTFGKLTLRKPVVCKRELNGIIKTPSPPSSPKKTYLKHRNKKSLIREDKTRFFRREHCES